MAALLAFVFAALWLVAGPAEARDAPSVQLRITSARGTADATVPVAQLTRITLAKGRTIAVEARYDKASGNYQVVVYRSVADRDPKTLKRADFTLSQTLTVPPGGSTSISVPSGESIAVNIGMGPPLDTSDGPKQDCTCCVTCENGVVLCACRVRSSCGNCDGRG
jgi:hypothetical protein